MERDAYIVSICEGKKESEIVTLLNVARSFVYKVRNELVASVDKISTVSERKRQYKNAATNRSGTKYY